MVRSNWRARWMSLLLFLLMICDIIIDNNGKSCEKMALQKIWDYVMRRKAGFLCVLGVMIVACFLGKLIPQQIISSQKSIEADAAGEYQNGLDFRVADVRGGVGLELNFAEDFRTVTIRLGESALREEAYVRILNGTGQLVAGEYTTVRELAEKEGAEEPSKNTPGTEAAQGQPAGVEYYFSGAPKAYAVALQAGYQIEIRSGTGKFYSTLDGLEAEDFQPGLGHDFYVVTDSGLGKNSWTAEQTTSAMYKLLRRYLTSEIESYRNKVSEEILFNKKLDTTNKARVKMAYYSLAVEDRAEYAEFIRQLERGGVPQLKYLGLMAYKIGEMADFANLVVGFDNEDGEISAERITLTGEVDFGKAGEYTIEYEAQDSDGNVTRLMVPIKVVQENPPSEEDPSQPSDKPNDGEQDGPFLPGDTIEPVGPGGIVDEGGLIPGAPGTIGGGANADNSTNQRPTGGMNGEAPAVNRDPSGVSDTVWDDGGNSGGDERSNSGEDANGSANSEDGALQSAENSAGDAEKTDNNRADSWGNKNESTSKSSQNQSDKERKEGGLAQNIVWIIVGVIVVAGLVRFIFDHYVR